MADISNADEFPPLDPISTTGKRIGKKFKPKDLADNNSASLPIGGKKLRPNGTTPPAKPTKSAVTPTNTDSATNTTDLSFDSNKLSNSSTTNNEILEINGKPHIDGDEMPASQRLARKLDTALANADVSIMNRDPRKNVSKDIQWIPNTGEEKKALTFSIGTSFSNTTVDSQVRKIRKSTKDTTPTTADKTPTTKAKSPTYSSVAAIPPITTARTKTAKPSATSAYIDPAPQGVVPEPMEHSYSFVARVVVTVPNCASFQYKVMNLLAYAMNVLRQYDSTAAFLHIMNPDKQAATIHELPKIQEFLKEWSYFEHTVAEFKHFTLEPGKTKKYRGSVLIGCNMEPNELLSDSLLDLDRDLDANIGGGKITLEYKQMQVVDTDRSWMLFGVPSETHPESFGALLKTFLQHSMWKMRDKNPTKYSAAKYSASIPEFFINIMYANVPYKMSEGLPGHAKLIIHIEIRQSDRELFKNLFRFITLAKLDKKIFGQFSRFYYGPPPGSLMSEREDLGNMLQNHVAVVRSLGKVSLTGIMHPDKIMACQLADDADGEPRDTVHMSLRRILMKQRIGRPKVWQCILPNAGGGWDGFYSNGLGCGEHRQQALNWAVCVPAHLRFHLLKKGVLVESMSEFINQVFTCEAASEAFSAKLIKGEVYTYGAASAASMRMDIENCGWVDVSLGKSNTQGGATSSVLSRPKIALKVNGDLSAHNFSIDRNPEIQETMSVAYSTTGETTLGDGEYENPDEEVEVNITEHDDDNNSIMTMDGSTESQMWNSKKPSAKSVIDNMDMVMDTDTQAAASFKTTYQVPDQQNQLADLLKQIELLKTSNEELMAAVANNTSAPTMVSHLTLQQPEKAGNPCKGDGGMN